MELRNLTKTLFPGRRSFCRKKREIMESFALQKHPYTAQYYCCWERMDKIKIEFHPWDESLFIFGMKVFSYFYQKHPEDEPKEMMFESLLVILFVSSAENIRFFMNTSVLSFFFYVILLNRHKM